MTSSVEEHPIIISAVEKLAGRNVVNSEGDVVPEDTFMDDDGLYDDIHTKETVVILGAQEPYLMGPHESRVEDWLSSHDVYGNPNVEDACAALGIGNDAYLAEVAASIEAWQTNNRSPQDKLGSRALTNARSK